MTIVRVFHTDTLGCYNPTVVIPRPGGVVVRTGEAAFLRVREAALVLGISNSAAYELASAWLASDGRTGLPAVRMGRRILIPRAAIDGLLQICTERTILRHERLVGLRLGAYVASKVAILVPFLLLVVVATLGVLRLLDRLPGRPLSTYASMGISLLLCAVAALGLGLLTSATVRNVAQATLALPMLCFPAVLFSGAILPVNLMARAGAGLSMVIPSAGPSKPSATTSEPGASSPRAARHSGLRSSPPTAMPAPSPPAPTGSSSQRLPLCSSSPPGSYSCTAHANRCAERRTKPRTPAPRPPMVRRGTRRSHSASRPSETARTAAG